jgi:hypothetical protein
MNRSNLILTHAAVFAVGITAAMIVNSTRSASGGSDGSGANPSNSRPLSPRYSEQSASRSLSEGSATPGRESRASAHKEAGTPAERLAKITRITDSLDRQRALMDLVDQLGPAEFASVADQFRELDHLGNSGSDYGLILRGWAKADPVTALEYVSQHSENGWDRPTILTTWAGQNPAAAERWALEHHQGDSANPHMAAVIRGIAGNDLATATRLAESMPRSNERGEAVNSITQALLIQGMDAAMAFPASIKDETLRGGFVAAIAQRLVTKDVNKAAAWLASMPQGQVQNRAARNVADGLAKIDPVKAAAWVSTLKPEAQAEAARGVIPIMSSADIPGTAKWVTNLAGTPGYDDVVEEFVWSCDVRAPEQSAAWIQGVSNQRQQTRLFHRMLGDWARRDPAAVKQWVSSNKVPDSVFRRFTQ